MKPYVDAAVGAIETAAKIAQRLGTLQDGSLTDFAKQTRVEPIVLVDQRAVHLPYMPDVMQSLVSIFSGYYLQAVSLSVNVGAVDTLRLLDKLNPRRNGSSDTGDLFNATARTIYNVATESRDNLLHETNYLFKLPVPGGTPGLEDINHNEAIRKVAGEDAALIHDKVAEGNFVRKQNYQNIPGDTKTTFGRDAIGSIGDQVNLSVGKLLEVHIESNGQKATFPISVRLMANPIASESLLHILSVGNKMTSASDRYHAWRAGELSLIRDLILCQDLIDQHKKTLANDKSGIYADILARRRGNNTAAILSGNVSMATASNICVLTDATAAELERRMHGARLKDYHTREKVFKETYMMLMVVVHPEWEQVTIYHRGLDVPTRLSVKDIKASNKGNGPDVAEILKAYQLGNSPSL